MKNRLLTIAVIHFKADKNLLYKCINSIKRAAKKQYKKIQIDIIHGKNGKEIDWSSFLKDFDDMYIRVFNNPKSEVNFQNQLSIDVCETDYWTVLDDDDELEDDSIDKFLEQFNPKENIDCYQLRITRYGKEQSSWIASMIMNHAKIYKIQSIRENNIYFHEKLTTNEDAWFGTLFTCFNPKIKGLDIPFYKWIEVENSITDQWKKNNEKWKNINLLTIKLLIEEYKKRKQQWAFHMFKRTMFIHILTAKSSGCTDDELDLINEEIKKVGD